MQTFFLGFPWYTVTVITTLQHLRVEQFAVSQRGELQFSFAHGANQAIAYNYIIINLQVHSQRSTKNVTMKPCKMMCSQYDRLWAKGKTYILFSFCLMYMKTIVN